MVVFFFFSSRRRHTRYWRDWSSDVCSSDLGPAPAPAELGWDVLDDPRTRDRHAEMLIPSRYVIAEPEVAEVAAGLRAAHPPAEAGRRAAGWVHNSLEYVRGVT